MSPSLALPSQSRMTCMEMAGQSSGTNFAALHAVHGAHQRIFLFQNSKDLALIAALYPGVCKLFHQHLVAGHCAAGEPAGDKDIAGAVLQHDKGKVLAQLYHLAQQCLIGTAAAHGEEHAWRWQMTASCTS